ncbi:MAG: hypothetical protein WCX48_09750 [Bacteroidales bacterium]|jgi:hypothetical protein
MTNTKISRKGNVLTIVVDLSKPGTPSASGKTKVVASTNGNQPVEGDGEFFIGLNVYTKKGK